MSVYLAELTFLLGIWEVLICFEFMEFAFGRAEERVHRRKIQWLSAIAAAAAMTYNKVSFLIYSSGMLVVLGLAIGILCAVIYKEKARLTLAVSFTYQIAVYLLDLIILYITGILWDNPTIGMETGTTTPEISILYTFLSRLILWLIVHGIRKHVVVCKEKVRFYLRLLVFFIFVGYWGIIYFQRIFLYEMTALLVFNGFTYICTVLFGTLVFVIYILYQKSKEKATLIYMRNKLLERNHDSMKIIYDQNAKVFHDFRNHLAVLHSMLTADQQEQAVKYIERVSEPLVKVSKRIDSHNEAIDIVLNYKIAEAEEKLIRVDAVIEDCDLINIPRNEMSALIANIMDNAIEAAEKLPPNKRWIKVRTRKKNHFWIFQLSNSISIRPEVRNGKLRSIKKNGRHGLGMENIQDIIEQYDGYMTYDYDDLKFEINLFLSV